MKPGRQLYLARWWLLALIVILQLTILFISPEEKTLGVGIKPVYLHVSLTWTGMILFLINGLLGLANLIIGKEPLINWQRSVFLSALWFYGIGFLVSMYASWLNWGGIPYQEPRIQGAINVFVSAIAVWVLSELTKIGRVNGILGWIPIAFIFATRQSSSVVLHPDNPVSTSPLSIKATFISMWGLSILLAIWFIWVHRKQSQHLSTQN
ncbi:MAG: hypothetical protein GWN62_19785 [Aliifodinibius sp.]|nr:hypothetical protein [Fodinibius sp.]